MALKIFNFSEQSTNTILVSAGANRGDVMNGMFEVGTDDNWETCFILDDHGKRSQRHAAVARFVADVPKDWKPSGLRNGGTPREFSGEDELLDHVDNVIHMGLRPFEQASGVPQYLAARWTTVFSASFQDVGLREALGQSLSRLAEDIDRRDPASVDAYAPILLLDINGSVIGDAVFTSRPPLQEPVDGNPFLIIPVKDLDCTAIAVTDINTRLQSCIEDVHTLSHVDDLPVAHFFWRDLPALERQYHKMHAVTPESMQATHSRVREQMAKHDEVGSFARFGTTYKGIETAAERLGLKAHLKGFGDAALVGYLKDGEWTAIATEILCDGKALTTVNGHRTPGTGYTNDGEWQFDQLQCALARLSEDTPRADVYAAAADLYEEPLSDTQQWMMEQLKRATLTFASFAPDETYKNEAHIGIFADGVPVILTGPHDDPLSVEHAWKLAGTATMRRLFAGASLSVGEVAGRDINWLVKESALVPSVAGVTEVGGDVGEVRAIVLNDPTQERTVALAISDDVMGILEVGVPEAEETAEMDGP